MRVTRGSTWAGVDMIIIATRKDKGSVREVYEKGKSIWFCRGYEPFTLLRLIYEEYLVSAPELMFKEVVQGPVCLF